MSAKIAVLPDDNRHYHCSRCGDDNLAIAIVGSGDCEYCGNEVVLCAKCANQLVRELKGKEF